MVNSAAGYYNGYFDYVERQPRKTATGPNRQGQSVLFHSLSFKEKITTTLRVSLFISN